MRCEDAQEQLSLERYGVARTSDLGAHLLDCAACREFVRRSERLDQVLALDEPALPGPGFDTRFFERLREQKAGARRKHFWLWPSVLATALAAGAAAVVIAVRDPDPANLPAEEMELALELELIEELDVVQQLEQVEEPQDYELLSQIDEAELEALLAEPTP